MFWDPPARAAQRKNRKAIVVLICAAAVFLLALPACGGKPEATPTPQAIPAPPAFPFIFSGKFTVDGRPGPAGVKIFARIGTAKSPLAETIEGRYRNVILGPADPVNQRGAIAFFLGDPDGKTVQAKETYAFRLVGQPTNVELELTFPGLPE